MLVEETPINKKEERVNKSDEPAMVTTQKEEEEVIKCDTESDSDPSLFLTPTQCVSYYESTIE
jgi:hypothetical protein